MVRLQTELRLRVGEGDSRRIALNFRDYGSYFGKDLSGYSSILFEWADGQGVAQTPIPVSQETVGSDWDQGTIVLELTSDNVTATPGDYSYSITLVSSTETQTVVTGIVEVFDRDEDPDADSVQQTVDTTQGVVASVVSYTSFASIASVGSTTPYTARSADLLNVNAANNAVRVNVGDGTELVGESRRVAKTDSTANAVTVYPSAGTIDGEPFLKLTNQYDSVSILKVGPSNWTVTADGRRKTGFFDYSDATGAFALTANTWTDMPNDGAGASTNMVYAPSGVSDLLDEATGYLDFTELSLGDQVMIRLDFTVTPSLNNALLEVQLALGAGEGAYTLSLIQERLDNGSGIGYHKVIPFPLYMGDANTRDNPCKIQVKLSTSGTCTNAGVYIKVDRR